MDSTAPAGFYRGAVTRFAPSPTGELHLGNARTALFNFLLARRAGGRFLLRIEDTDAQRSQESHLAVVLEDLRWLGLNWDAGPDREDDRGPYRQSQRGALYARFFEALEGGRRRPIPASARRSSWKPRAALSSAPAGRRATPAPAAIYPPSSAAKRAQGLPATLRFRVPAGRRIEFARPGSRSAELSVGRHRGLHRAAR